MYCNPTTARADALSPCCTAGLIVFGCGVLCGIALSIHFIRRALQQYRPQTVYLILGLMLGSLYAIVMGPATLAVPQAPLSLSTFSIPGFLIGIAVLGGLEAMRHMIERKRRRTRTSLFRRRKTEPPEIRFPELPAMQKAGADTDILCPLRLFLGIRHFALL